MCTAAAYKTKDFYFGRTLDYEFSYGDEVVITPRNYPFRFLEQGEMKEHYAIIGMACVMDDYPLYYDAVNEKGLGLAGLNFVGNAVYRKREDGKDNVAQFELIPWLLGQCASVREARKFLDRLNITNIPFRDDLPLAQLHWILADKQECVVIESVAEGVKIYENPVGVLTNNPPFDMQMFALNNYMALSVKPPKNSFAPGLTLDTYSRGMGAMGLPGDLSSQSRFVRVAFTKMNSCCGEGETESVSQFFHILGSVDQQRGCCELESGKYEVTLYTSCCNADRGIYYYTAYNNHQINGVDMYRENLDTEKLIRYPAIEEEQIRMQN
ncbi:MAG: choloylglycine hydrolase [Bacteroidales bacterium]|nr:choloylglycine hydrolase [Bacteroidales bacterium]MCM1415553.1 choloylglycine hydrolase [bacterium]MCM1424386.1 choloylglycine hydrolase [bacterium]